MFSSARAMPGTGHAPDRWSQSDQRPLTENEIDSGDPSVSGSCDKAVIVGEACWLAMLYTHKPENFGLAEGTTLVIAAEDLRQPNGKQQVADPSL